MVGLAGAERAFAVREHLTPTALIAAPAHVVAMHPGVGARNVAELIALAKARPGHFTFGSSGTVAAAVASGPGVNLAVTSERATPLLHKSRRRSPARSFGCRRTCRASAPSAPMPCQPARWRIEGLMRLAIQIVAPGEA